MRYEDSRRTVPWNGQAYGELRDLVAGLVKTLEWKSGLQKTDIINRIPEDLMIETQNPLLKVILQYLLNAIISCTRDGSISLHAKNYTTVTLVHLKCSGINTDAMHSHLSRLQPVAEKIKGSVSITSKIDGVTTITFGFPQNEI